MQPALLHKIFSQYAEKKNILCKNIVKEDVQKCLNQACPTCERMRAALVKF